MLNIEARVEHIAEGTGKRGVYCVKLPIPWDDCNIVENPTERIEYDPSVAVTLPSGKRLVISEDK